MGGRRRRGLQSNIIDLIQDSVIGEKLDKEMNLINQEFIFKHFEY